MDEFDLDREQVASIARVLRALTENESDGDHVRVLMDTYNQVITGYTRAVWPDRAATREDVEVTIEVFKELIPTREELDAYDGDSHPNAIYSHALEFVESEYRYMHGVLPNPEEGPVDG